MGIVNKSEEWKPFDMNKSFTSSGSLTVLEPDTSWTRTTLINYGSLTTLEPATSCARTTLVNDGSTKRIIGTKIHTESGKLL